MIKKNELLNKLMICKKIKMVNFYSKEWDPINTLILWKSKDNNNAILLDINNLEWSYANKYKL